MLAQELVQAAEIARKAGEILMEIYATDFDVAYKGRDNPVTVADTRANAFIVRALQERFPEDGIIAEESANRGDAQTRARCWFVDPLDGTKEFIAKNGEFAVMIGLAIDGEAKLGVVYQPAHDKLYRGVVGHGAELEQGGTTRPLSVSEVAEPGDLTLVVSRSHRSKSTDKIVSALGIQRELRSGSVGLKVGIISEQTADLYVHVSDKACKWDACGPEAVVRAAGGRFSDLGGGPFDYRESELRNTRGILACNAAAFDKVLPAVRALGKEVGYLT
ncbi:MAG: 3'(2'),5'-bisphosphate nucleotidase CysQ [Myxococcales bacterium]|nr:3'(2'),5'-bisphosphate nucleotidase CysQ [Myxococcales bacterium]MDD9966261.1 3'(2'),5'-bisphosphate nucleotidase CysQ [Myxococcales bacterium]